MEAEKDNVVVPTTLEEYCIKHKNKPAGGHEEQDMADFYDDDYCDDLDVYADDDDNVYDDDGDEDNDDDDSGNGESWSFAHNNHYQVGSN